MGVPLFRTVKLTTVLTTTMTTVGLPDTFTYTTTGRTDPHGGPAEASVGELQGNQCRVRSIEHPSDVRGKVDRGGYGPSSEASMGPNQKPESGTEVPPISPSLCRQPLRIRANNG
jgi:hypothetical protein